MSEEIDKLAGATSLKISEMTLESDLTGAEKFPFVREGIKTNFITTLNRIKEYVQKDVCTVIYELKSTDLNTFKGDEAKICVIGVQKSNELATLGNHYPVQESGILIAVGTIADKANQIYQTYNSNRLFIRCATSSGVDGEFSEWQEIAKVTDVLTKTNTSSFTPTGDYQPATKKYVDDIAYGKVIVISDISKFLYSVNLNGTDAEQRIVDLFGSIDNFKNVVADILANHTRYYFHINNNCIELGCVNTWRANDSTSYELHFIITYFGNNPVKMFTNRISIISNDDNRESKVIIASLVNSDNISVVTKKTAAEYDAIGSKDANTAYYVTD